MAKKKTYLVTASGLKNMKKELDEKKKKYKETKEVLSEMVDDGDLSENDGYSLALEDSLSLEGDIAQLEEKIENATVVKATTKGKIEIGDKVKIKGSEREMTITIVGENEANPLENKVSYNSPMGKAILGKKKGDEFQFKNPKGTVKYKILDILD